MSTETILGIDPGTRFIGIAVLHNGVLVHHQIRSFQGPWSRRKLKAIIHWLGTTITRYSINKEVVKIPDVFPTSPGFNQLIGALNLFCESKGMKPSYYSLSDIKARHCKDRSQARTDLASVIVRKHPELMPEYRKERHNKNAHYFKLFEAVAVAHM